MSRDRGPRVKKMRAVGMELPGLSRKSIERKPNPPGMREGQFKKKKSEVKIFFFYCCFYSKIQKEKLVFGDL